MPLPLLLIGGGLAFAGAATSAVGGILGSRSRAKAAEEEARILEIETAEAVRAAKIQLKRVLSTQRANFSASGVRVDVGTPQAVKRDTKREGQRQISLIRELGAARADLFRDSAKDTRRGGLIAAGGTLLGGAGKLAAGVHAQSQVGE